MIDRYPVISIQFFPRFHSDKLVNSSQIISLGWLFHQQLSGLLYSFLHSRYVFCQLISERAVSSFPSSYYSKPTNIDGHSSKLELISIPAPIATMVL